MRVALEAVATRCPRRDRRRTLRQLLHGQHAVVRDRHGRLVPTARSKIRLARDRQGDASLATAHCRERLITLVMQRSDVAYARGMAVRPRDHGAAPLPDTALRPCRSSRPTSTARVRRSRRSIGRGRSASRCAPPPTPSPNGSRSSAPAGSRTGRPRPTRARSTSDWDREFLTAGSATTVRPARLHRPRRVRRGRPGRLRDPHVHRGQRGRGAGARGTVHFYAPIPIFAVGCTVATYDVQAIRRRLRRREADCRQSCRHRPDWGDEPRGALHAHARRHVEGRVLPARRPARPIPPNATSCCCGSWARPTPARSTASAAPTRSPARSPSSASRPRSTPTSTTCSSRSASTEPLVTDRQNCGNLLAGVAPFAVERGLRRPPTTARPASAIHMVNTDSIADRHVPGRATAGRSIPATPRSSGVPGTAAPIRLDFDDIAGGTLRRAAADRQRRRRDRRRRRAR